MKSLGMASNSQSSLSTVAHRFKSTRTSRPSTTRSLQQRSARTTPPRKLHLTRPPKSNFSSRESKTALTSSRMAGNTRPVNSSTPCMTSCNIWSSSAIPAKPGTKSRSPIIFGPTSRHSYKRNNKASTVARPATPPTPMQQCPPATKCSPKPRKYSPISPTKPLLVVKA